MLSNGTLQAFMNAVCFQPTICWSWSNAVVLSYNQMEFLLDLHTAVDEEILNSLSACLKPETTAHTLSDTQCSPLRALDGIPVGTSALPRALHRNPCGDFGATAGPG